MAVNTNDWQIEAKSYWDPRIKCEMTYEICRTVCGTDENDYNDLAYLRCAQINGIWKTYEFTIET